MRPISFFLQHPHSIFASAAEKIKWLIPDKLYLKILYRERMGRKLNLRNPKAFSEKLQWLKLYDRRPEYTTMVDKYAVKDYVASKIGEECIIPTIGVWNKTEDIDWNSLPAQFVLKTTHDSGTVIICRDKESFDRNAAIKKLNRSLHQNYYIQMREWPYKNVPHRIIAEKYLDVLGSKSSSIPDYKFFCMNGEPRVLLYCTDRANGTSKWDFFDMDMKRLPYEAIHHQNTETVLTDYSSFEKLKSIARVLAQNIPFVSVDLYYIEGQTYFGELTFFSGSGFLRFNPADFDYELGNSLKLPVRSC